jgi:hypothetical protein
MKLILIIPLAMFFCRTVANAQTPLSPAAFRDCIGPNGTSPVCVLEPNPSGSDAHIIQHNNYFEVGRSGIVVAGTYISSRRDTTLRRAVPSTAPLTLTPYPLMKVKAGIHNVIIRDFVFDGSRNATDLAELHLPESQRRFDKPYRCLLDNSGIFIELDAGEATNITISADFENSIWVASTLGSASTVRYSRFKNGRMAAVYSASNDISIVNSEFDSHGVGPVSVRGDRAQIRGNRFWNNHSEFSYGESGGTIFIEPDTDDVVVANNYMDGYQAVGYLNAPAGVFGCIVPPPASGMLRNAGVEAYGTNIRLYNNRMINHSGSGAYFTGVSNVRVDGQNDAGCPTCPLTAVQNNNASGVSFNAYPGYPNNTNITINQLTSQNNLPYNLSLNALSAAPNYQPDGNARICLSPSSSNRYGGDPAWAPPAIDTYCANSTNGTPIVQAATITNIGSNFSRVLLSMQATDAQGGSDIKVIRFLVQNGLDGANACYGAYNSDGYVVLADNSGTVFSVGFLPGQDVMENSQCRLRLATSSVSQSGNTKSLVLDIESKTAFAGRKFVFVASEDIAAFNSGWQFMGNWMVPTVPTQTVNATAITPIRSSGMAQTISFTASHASGFSSLGVVNLLINDALDATFACYLAYSETTNAVYLVDDLGSILQGGYAIGSASPNLSNTQCKVNVSQGVAVKSGTTVTITLPIEFKFPFKGNRGMWVAAGDENNSMNSGWQPLATIGIQ